MKHLIGQIFFATAMIFAVGCSPSASQLKKTLESDPTILADAIKKHPVEVMEAIQTAAQEAQKGSRDREAKEEETRREEEFKNPKQAQISDDRAYQGPKDAPIVLIEYSDFECPFCKRGYETVNAIKAKYGNKVRFIFKNLPLDFHPMAMPAAKRFEAIALQSPEKAFKFHDEVFAGQDKLRTEKEKFLDAAARKAGADIAKMKKDMEGEEVKKRIEADMAEAKQFGFQGTPGYLVGGISLKGAYPLPEFEKIIDRLLKDKGVN
ncbi:MAG: DsbA family protein [Bdellovibrionales bacterium]